MTKLVGKSRLSLSAVYRNGVPMLTETDFISDVMERKSGVAAGKTVLALVVPDSIAAVLKEALMRGDVELNIEGVAPPMER